MKTITSSLFILESGGKIELRDCNITSDNKSGKIYAI